MRKNIKCRYKKDVFTKWDYDDFSLHHKITLWGESVIDALVSHYDNDDSLWGHMYHDIKLHFFYYEDRVRCDAELYTYNTLRVTEHWELPYAYSKRKIWGKMEDYWFRVGRKY